MWHAFLLVLPIILGSPWLATAQLPSLPLLLHVILLHVPMSKFPSFIKDTSYIRFGLTLMISSYLIISTKTLFSNKRSHSQVLEVRTSTYLFVCVCVCVCVAIIQSITG